MRERIELVVAGALATLGIVLHALFVRASGNLWRDEVVSLRIAEAPFRAMWQGLRFESFFVLWPIVLRVWTSITGPYTLRYFGFLMGVAAIAAAWIAVRLLGGRTAIIAIAILATNAAVIRYGDSIRGYGIGMIAGVLAFALIGRMTDRRSFVVALLASVVSVHTTYPNSILVFACCVAAAIVQKSWKPLAMGFVAAVTLVPYALIVVARANDALRDANLSFALIAARLVSTLGIAAAIAVGAALLWRRQLNYPTLVVLILVPLHIVYMKAVGYFPQPWYFTLPIIILAVAADVNLALPPLPRTIIAAAIVAISIPAATARIAQRQTNIDDAATLLTWEPRPGDLIVVYPWYLDASFSLYYHGNAEWQTLPPIADHSVQRIDLIARAVATPGAEQPLVARVATTLQQGKAVWLIGFPLFADRAIGADLNAMTPVEAADARWCTALLNVLRREAHHEEVRLRGGDDTIIFERVNVAVFRR